MLVQVTVGVRDDGSGHDGRRRIKNDVKRPGAYFREQAFDEPLVVAGQLQVQHTANMIAMLGEVIQNLA